MRRTICLLAAGLVASIALDAETRYARAASMNRHMEDLISGQTTRLTIDPVSSPRLFTGLYRVSVPADATELELRLLVQTPGVELNLFTRYDTDVTLEDGRPVITFGSEGPAVEKVILVTPGSKPPLQPGWYYIALGLVTPGTAVSATFTATVRTPTSQQPPPPLPTGDSTRIIATIAGTDPPLPLGQRAVDTALGDFAGVAVDRNGDVLFSAQDLDAVFRIVKDGNLVLVAGSGIKGYSGDGGAATSARLNNPSGLAMDASGSLFIADENNHAIRKVTSDGTITTVAGIGRLGFSGDGGPATDAALNSPRGVAVDSAGNLYIYDALNQRIRRVEPVGVITTYAGNGTKGFSGDGGPARNAALSLDAWGAGGLSADQAGNVLIADIANHRVRKVSADGLISTLAGTGASEQDAGEGAPASASPAPNPTGVAADRAGSIYIATSTWESFRRTVGSHWKETKSDFGRVRQALASGAIRTVAGGYTTWAGNDLLLFAGDGGPATQATLRRLGALAWDPVVGLVIVDGGNGRLRRVGPDGIIQTVGGNGQPRPYTGVGGPALSAVLGRLGGIAVDQAGNLYLSDYENRQVRTVGPDGALKTVVGNGGKDDPVDGEPALDVSIGQVFGMIADGGGNLYLADTAKMLVYKLSPDGRLRFVAGNHSDIFSGDGESATRAGVDAMDVAVDRAGNLFIADMNNHRVRKVTPGGIISTVAGTGTAGFSGDMGPATSARLNVPCSVTVDSAGNLYISDYQNQRIRKVDATGIITTVAGLGAPGFTGDGGPATLARLNLTGLSMIRTDTSGALFISDTKNNRIRRIGPDGTISTAAGSGDLGYAGDGGPANRASLAYPGAIAVDRTGNLYIADTENYRIRVVLANAPSYDIAPTTIDFSGPTTGAPPPERTVDLISRVSGLAFSASVSTSSGGNWLRITPQQGVLPAALRVAVDSRGMVPGVYEGTITVTVPNAEPAARLVTVKLTVFTPPPPARLLEVSTTRLTFSFIQGGALASAALGVISAAGTPLSFGVGAATTSGGAWLSVTPASETTSDAATVTVTARPAGMAAGTYSGTITVNAGAERVEVPVTMTIQQTRRSLLLSHSGLTFRAVSQAGAPLPQKFRVLTLGGAPLSWSVQAATLAGGSKWLKVTALPASSSVDVSVDPAGLAAGDYHGRVLVEAPEAANSPQSISVFLSVLPPGSNPGPEVRPVGLVFAGAPGMNPPPQEILIANLRTAPIGYVSGRLTLDGKEWFVHQPVSATIQADRPGRVQVYPDFQQASPGIRRGVVTLLFDDGAVRTVDVLSIVASGSASSKPAVREAGGCSPTRLVPQVVSLASGFQEPMFWPVTLEVKVLDDCANASTSGAVVARFSSGDPQVSLIPVGEGTWIGTWQPRAARPDGVRLVVQASSSLAGVSLEGQTEVSGSLRREAAPPLVAPGGVVSWGSPLVRGTLAPGSLISIQGEQLAGGSSTGIGNPLSVELGGTAVFLAGRLLPLLQVSDRRVDAQVVYGLGVNAQHQLVVRRGAEISLPEPVTVAEAQPAILTKDGSGTGQGLIFSGDTLAEPGKPARAGATVVLQCVGLGEVTPSTVAGALATANPPVVAGSVSVAIGGKPAQVQLASLLPDRVGVYQVRVIVPAGVSPAGNVPVVLTVAGQTSPPVTIAVE